MPYSHRKLISVYCGFKECSKLKVKGCINPGYLPSSWFVWGAIAQPISKEDQASGSVYKPKGASRHVVF